MNRWLLAAAAAATLALPPLLPERHLATYVLLGLAATVTAGVSMLMGYAGQISLGQAGFYAIGGYTAGLLTVHGAPTLAGLLAAPVVASVAAVLLGAPLLRLRGHHLAFATLALQLILLSLLAQGEWAGGAIGLQGIPQLSLGGELGYAYLVWAVLAVVLLVSRNVVASRAGRGLRAAGTSEVAAAASGVAIGRYRLAVFALSAAFAGLAGGIYAFYVGYLAPGSFPVLLSIEFVVMAVVGGLGTIAGPVVGATVIVLLVQALNTLGTQPGMPGYAPSVLSYAVYALLLIVTVLYLPRGIVPALTRRAWRGTHETTGQSSRRHR